MILIKLFSKGTTEITEIDCVETMFMSPFHLPVTFGGNSSFVGARGDRTCRWNFVVITLTNFLKFFNIFLKREQNHASPH